MSEENKAIWIKWLDRDNFTQKQRFNNDTDGEKRARELVDRLNENPYTFILDQPFSDMVIEYEEEKENGEDRLS